jgi:6-pyruvoyltetrahydropterin/6-carboxytetrahydropterin synthase
MSSYIYIDGWKSNIRFSSAHLIPEYEKCGQLHGHTYAVHVKVSGKPDGTGIILDFTLLKDTLRKIVSELDHKLLIPKKSNLVSCKKENNILKLNAIGKNYVLPLNDCILLPINSTSAENLASFILDQLLEINILPKHVDCVEIGVDEGFGQGARIIKNF